MPTIKDLQELKQEVFDYIRLGLGDQMVDVELDPEHYEAALARAFRVYRQRAENAVEESFVFLATVDGQSEYTLADEITDVRVVHRRTLGSTLGSTGADFEPFESAYLNYYMLDGGRQGGLLSYELYSGYRELTARMFGGYINFTWNKVTKLLTLHKKVDGDDEVLLLHVYNVRPEANLLTDTQIRPWIEDYAMARCKFMLGEARSKFSTIAGPQGGGALNGDALKSEAQQEMEKLEEDLKNYIDGSAPLTFIIG